jgi:heme A synthase
VSALRTIHRYWASLITLAVVVQIGFAGYGAFDAADKLGNGSIDEDTFEDGFGLHAALGSLLVPAGLLLLLVSFGTRSRSRILWSLLAFGLLVVQMILGWTGSELPAVLGFLHPVNALIILAVLGSFTGRMWREDRMMTAAAPTTAAAPPPSV